MTPKLRHALDDMMTSSVKSSAVATHDIVNSVTPNLRQHQSLIMTTSGTFVNENGEKRENNEFVNENYNEKL